MSSGTGGIQRGVVKTALGSDVLGMSNKKGFHETTETT